LSAFDNESFDAVLLMGPLYHLLEERERRLAMTEALRVLKPAGALFTSCITRYAAFMDAARKEPHWLIEKPDHVEALLHAGALRIPPGRSFTDFYVFHPVEFAAFFEAAGMRAMALIGVEGVVANAEESINALDGEAWDAWVEMNYQLGHDPSLHGASFHLLHVGRKQGRFASAIVRRGDEILLQQAQGPDDAAPCWYLPGGKVEPFETFEQALIREVREETGIEVKHAGPLAYTTHMQHAPSGRAGIAHIFEVDDWGGEIHVDDPDGVTLQARFVPVAEAIALIEGTLPYPNMREPLLACLRDERLREWHFAGDDDAMRRINP
jgi:8-oxo-dGTP pyrophosphatase MutT (NUDIX family)